MTWAQTRTGCAVDLLRPDPDTIRLHDIAVALSRLPRFLGHTIGPRAYSVAQHSTHVESLLPEGTDPRARLAVLLHDAHEAYTGDFPSPLKEALGELRAAYGHTADPLAVIQRGLQDAIDAAFGLDMKTWPAELVCGLRAMTKRADLLALAIEKRDLMAPEPREWCLFALPDPGDAARIGPEHAAVAAADFAGRACSLATDAGIVLPPGLLS